MTTRVTAAADGSATLYGLTAGREYDVTASLVALAQPPGIVVPKVPTGVPGDWVNVFADAFAVPFGLGTGQNNRWYPNRGGSNPNENRPGDNSNELQVYNASQVSQDAEGLRLRALYKAGVVSGKNFVSGTVRTSNASPPAGYKLFKWKPTAGQAWALEIKWKLPQTTGEMDPGFWSTDSAWTAELDHPEVWGYGQVDYQSYYRAGCPIWIYKTSPEARVGHWVQKESELVSPLAGTWHTFTTVVNADGTHDFYFDGAHKWHVEKPPVAPNRPYMGVIVQNALRGGHKFGFSSGYRDLQARYVAVYTDVAHATQNFQNGGLAPGTVLG